MENRDERIRKNAYPIEDDELGRVTGGGKTGGGKHSGKPAALYSMGQQLRILAYDNVTTIVRVRGGSVNKMQYKNDIWQYQLDTGWGYSTDWYNENELGPG